MNTTPKIRVCLITFPSVIGATIINALRKHPHIELVGIVLEKSYLRDLKNTSRITAFLKKTGLLYSFTKILTTEIAWRWLKLRGFLRHYQGELRFESNINSPEVSTWLQELNCDYICASYCLLRLGDELLAMSKKRTVVMHASMLPRYGGPEPTLRLMSQNDYQNAGATIFTPSQILDAGDVLHQEKIPADKMAFTKLDTLLWKQGGYILADWLVADHAHAFLAKSMQPSASDYQSFPTAQEVRLFRKQGNLLDYAHLKHEINTLITEEALFEPAP